MRAIFFSGLLLAWAATAHAQVQERKLMDRLLKPDANLRNEAQGKRFVPGGAITTRQAAAKSFFVVHRPTEKKYTNLPSVETKAFQTKDAAFAQQQASTASRNSLTNLDTVYATRGYETHPARDAGKRVETSNYSGSREFVVRGKSQKSLDSHNRPMTIEQVRELLNKNK